MSYARCIPGSPVRGFLFWPLFRELQVGSGFVESLRLSAFQGFGQADLVDGTHAVGAHTQRNPLVLLGEEILAVLQVGRKGALGLYVGMAHTVAYHHFLSGYLADTGHSSIEFGRRRWGKSGHVG